MAEGEKRFRLWDSIHGAFWVRSAGGQPDGYTEEEERAGLWAESELEPIRRSVSKGRLSYRCVHSGKDDLEEVCELPNGSTLYREAVDGGAAGYRYWTDETGRFVMFWDASMIDPLTLVAAITEEGRRQIKAASGAGTPQETNMPIGPDGVGDEE